MIEDIEQNNLKLCEFILLSPSMKKHQAQL